ncbi:hypothetical protein FJZ20_00755 [Candidatus Pacearchaeota archaeon]|nr:hypothetical protein [Candidatus Pacearchaeota archaeon]
MVKKQVGELISQAKRKTRRVAGIVGLSAFLTFNSFFSAKCSSTTSPSNPDPITPVANLIVNPGSGQSPLETLIQLNGTPAAEIKEYKLKIDAPDAVVIASSSNYNATMGSPDFSGFPAGMFSTSTKSARETARELEGERARTDLKGRKFLGELTYESGRIDESSGIAESSISKIDSQLNSVRTGTLSNSIIIKGAAGSEEIISSTPISITRTYENLGENNITITLTGEVTSHAGRKSSPVIRTITVQPKDEEEYECVLNFNGIARDFYEETEHDMTLPQRDDKNNIVTYTSANPLDSKTKILSLEDYVLSVKGETGQTGEYVIRMNFNDYLGGNHSQNLSGNILTYDSIVNFSGVNFAFDEEDTHNVNLPSTDTNGNAVNYTSARALDSKIQVISLENYILSVEGKKDQIGTYNLEINFEDYLGRDKTQNVSGSIYDLLDLSGNLRSNESTSPIQGKIKIFDENQNLLETDKSDANGYNVTSSSGAFDFQVKKRVSELSQIKIQAALGIPGNRQGWVRTINIPSGDNRTLDIAAVPYGNFASNPDEFRNFMYETTGGDPALFDYENFTGGFIIIKQNPSGSGPDGEGIFTDEQANFIKNVVTPYTNSVEKILGISNYPITIEENSDNYAPGAGKIYIVPSTSPGGNPGYAGVINKYSLGRLVQGAVIYLREDLNPSDWGLKRVTLHENGHIIYPFHPNNQNSIMSSPGTNYYTNLDLKGPFISYEKTFLRTDGLTGIQHLDFILGNNFYK